MRNTKTRARDQRWRTWTGWLTSRRTSPVPITERLAAEGTGASTPLRAVAPGQHAVTRDDLKSQITTTAFAFRGYDVTNLGRGPELLEHRVFGPVVRSMLDRASVVCGEVLKTKVDLAARMSARAPSTLETFVEDTATIVAMELAQIQLLEDVLEVPV